MFPQSTQAEIQLRQQSRYSSHPYLAPVPLFQLAKSLPKRKKEATTLKETSVGKMLSLQPLSFQSIQLTKPSAVNDNTTIRMQRLPANEGTFLARKEDVARRNLRRLSQPPHGRPVP